MKSENIENNIPETGDRGWGALANLRVLDLTQALAGPYSTQMLADHGANVVKVEPIISNDLVRTTGEFHAADVEKKDSGYFHSVNRNKRSVCIDLKSPAGRDLILEMVPQFDVVVENFRAGVMDRLGLGYEELRARNPRLVYATIRGFGDPRSGESPYSEWPAFDVVAQAMGGIASITGVGPGQPIKIGPGIGDIVPGLFLAIGILSAYINARETGRGQFVDVSMVDAVLALSERMVQQWSFGKQLAHAEGNFHPLIAPFGFYPAKDGSIAIAAVAQDSFQALCRALGRAELAEQDGFNSREARGVSLRLVDQAVCEMTSQFTRQELVDRLGGKIPFGPVLTMAEIAEDPHFVARDMLAPITIPGLPEQVCVVGVPIKMSETPGQVQRRGPRLGENGDEILAECGFSVDHINELRRSGVIG